MLAQSRGEVYFIAMSLSSQTLRRHILLVEDNKALRASIAEILDFGGYKVTEAKNGEEALTILMENPPVNLILTDLEMPIMNGLEFIMELRKRNINIPFVIISSNDDKAQLALKLGAKSRVSKPFGYGELI